MSDKYTELRRLAEAATPGVWVKRSHPMMPSFVQAQRLNPSDPYDIEIMGEDDTLYPTREADVDFIAAANPTTILALLDELAAPQALNKRIAEEIRRLAAKCGDQSWADEMRREADILEGTK